jgi:hypothetical protein
MLKFLKKRAKKWHEHKITGGPKIFIMFFLIIFLMQLIMLLILLKQ